MPGAPSVGAPAALRPPPPDIPPPVCEPRSQIAPQLAWSYDRTRSILHIPTRKRHSVHYFFLNWSPTEWGDIPREVSCGVIEQL
ncbi:hypothetical protein [Streptomyces sp. NPDC050504]|uniref:hypothetical protein n=1 Tax=Streptomyces sp. NPDC050504 TaxID=3365618 RepID=UPI0037B7804F